MKPAARTLRIGGLVFATLVLVFGIVWLIQAGAQAPGAAGDAPGTASSPGYPAPPTAQPTLLPPGYPAPATPLPTVAPAESTALWATQFAAMTENAPVIPTAIGVVVGPQTVQNLDGQFQLDLPAGWRAWLGGTTSIKNYDDESLGGEGDFPPGGLKIQIGVGEISAGQSFEQWLSEWIVIETSQPDSALPQLVATEPLPYVLGNYTGVSYAISAHTPVMVIVLPVSGDRVIIIGLSPSDSSALPEGLSLLATIEVLPEQSQ